MPRLTLLNARPFDLCTHLGFDFLLRKLISVKNESGQVVNDFHKQLQDKACEVDAAESKIRQLELLVKDLESVVEKRAQNVAELDEQLSDEREEGLQRQNQIHHLDDLLRESKTALAHQVDLLVAYKQSFETRSLKKIVMMMMMVTFK